VLFGLRGTSRAERGISAEKAFGKEVSVSTVGLDEDTVKKYIREQEAEGARLDQLNMFDEAPLQGAHKQAPWVGKQK
jgi:hypothetical protein